MPVGSNLLAQIWVINSNASFEKEELQLKIATEKWK